MHGGLGWGPRRKAALWAKGEPLGGRRRVYPGPGVWLGVAPLSAATAAPGLCWPPDVRWLQPAGPPPPRAQRGFIKSGCEEAREAAWLQLAGSQPRACRSQRAALRPLCPGLPRRPSPSPLLPSGPLGVQARGATPFPRKPRLQEQSGGVTMQENVFLICFLHPRGGKVIHTGKKKSAKLNKIPGMLRE